MTNIHYEWAKNELKLALEQEEKIKIDIPQYFTDSAGVTYDLTEGEVDAASQALRTLYYETLMGNENYISNASVLRKLLNYEPLTPIQGAPEEWVKIYSPRDEDIYLNGRRTTLTKTVKKTEDGETVTYSDNARYYCLDMEHKIRYLGDVGEKVLNEEDPITFPYMPPKEKIVVCTTHPASNLSAVLYFRYPDEVLKFVNRYFKLSYEKNTWEEIDGATFSKNLGDKILQGSDKNP